MPSRRAKYSNQIPVFDRHFSLYRTVAGGLRFAIDACGEKYRVSPRGFRCTREWGTRAFSGLRCQDIRVTAHSRPQTNRARSERRRGFGAVPTTSLGRDESSADFLRSQSSECSIVPGQTQSVGSLLRAGSVHWNFGATSISSGRKVIGPE